MRDVFVRFALLSGTGALPCLRCTSPGFCCCVFRRSSHYRYPVQFDDILNSEFWAIILKATKNAEVPL